jgi:hypothetical protein
MKPSFHRQDLLVTVPTGAEDSISLPDGDSGAITLSAFNSVSNVLEVQHEIYSHTGYSRQTIKSYKHSRPFLGSFGAHWVYSHVHSSR